MDFRLAWAKVGLALRIAQQSHYPCQCHDWVLREDGWDFVKRPPLR